MRRRQEGAPERSGLNRQKEGFGGEAVALSFRKGKGVPGMTIDGIVQFFDGRGSTSNPGRQGSGDLGRRYNRQKNCPGKKAISSPGQGGALSGTLAVRSPACRFFSGKP